MSELLAAVHRHRQSLFAIGMIALVAWLLWSARGALPAFFIGLALVFVLDPGVTFLQRRGIPRWAGVIVMYVVVARIRPRATRGFSGPVSSRLASVRRRKSC